MNYLGDFAEDSTVYILFTTSDSSGGAVAPSTAFEAADVAIYKDNGATQKTSTNGVTMTSPFDSVTGLHALTIDTSNDTADAGFWVTGSDYLVVLNPDETVDSQTVVGVIGSFSIENRFGIPASIESDIVAIESELIVVHSETTVIQAKTSDTHSRLVVVEASIDSDQTSRTAAISDVKSELVVISAAVATVDAAIDSDQTSRTAAISDVKSRLVVVESSIDSDQTSRTAAISDVKSRLVVVESAIDSDQTSRTAAISDVKSRLVVVESSIDSDQTSRTAAISDIKSELVVASTALATVTSDVALLEAAHAEPTGVPAANESPLDKLAYLFMALRNQVTVTASKKQFFDDAGTAEWEKDLTDDGTTYTETEANAP